MLICASKYEPRNMDQLPSIESTPEKSNEYRQYDDDDSEADSQA